MLANTIIIGVIITICTNNWITIWIGLEVSLLSFIPFIQNKSKVRSESIIKYFIVQRVASTILVIRVIYILIGVSIINEIILTISILIKLGLAPFHNWVLIIIEGISYTSILSLLTVLKLPPLVILYQINSRILTIPIIIRILLRAISGINQSSIKKTIGYSSVFNMSLIATVIRKINIIFIFIMIYTTIISMLMIRLIKNKVNFINQIIFNEFSPWIKINFWLNILSLRGFPPTIGFVLKLIIVQNLFNNNQTTILFVIVLTSILVSIFYIRIAFSSIMNFYIQKKWRVSLIKTPLFLTTINLLTFPFILSLVRIS